MPFFEDDDRRKFGTCGARVHYDDGFHVFHGQANIHLGSDISLVDCILNAGDSEGTITIEDFVFFGHRVMVLARGHDYRLFDIARQRAVTEQPILIKQGAWIGSGAIILGGVTVGRHSVVGAGAVVTKTVGDYEMVAGSPAVTMRGDLRKQSFIRRLKQLFRRGGSRLRP